MGCRADQGRQLRARRADGEVERRFADRGGARCSRTFRRRGCARPISQMNVLFHYAAGPDLAARLAAVPDLRITICPEHDDTLLARVLPRTDVIWHVLKRCTAEMIAAAPRLRMIQKIGVGVNTIDLDAAKA